MNSFFSSSEKHPHALAVSIKERMARLDYHKLDTQTRPCQRRLVNRPGQNKFPLFKGDDAFKSSALAAEMQFREARSVLELKSEQESRDPDPEFINACCKILFNLAPGCGPIRKLLSDLREEFVRHIYADFHTPAPGKSTLCQTPYFELVKSLEAELKHSLEMQDKVAVQQTEERRKQRESDALVKQFRESSEKYQGELLELQEKYSILTERFIRVEKQNHILQIEYEELSRNTTT